MHTPFIDNFESLESLCIVEPQGSSTHEVINLAIVEDVLRSDTHLTLVGSKEFIDYYANLLSLFYINTIISRLNYVVIKEPKSCWGISQLNFELKALRMSQNSERTLFLSVSPYTPIAVTINALVQFVTRKSMKSVSAIYHGNLANLLPRGMRPDPYLYRQKLRVHFHPLRFILQPRLTLILTKSRFGKIDFLLLSKHILNELKQYNVPHRNFRVIQTPIKTFSIAKEVKNDDQISILIIGRSPVGQLRSLIDAISKKNLDFLTLVCSMNYKVPFSSQEKRGLKFLPMDTREDIIQAATNVDALLMLRLQDESGLRLSGTLLEGIALSKPIIIPEWIDQIASELMHPIVTRSYHSISNLVGILSNRNELEHLIKNHLSIKPVK